MSYTISFQAALGWNTLGEALPTAVPILTSLTDPRIGPSVLHIRGETSDVI